MQYLC